MDSSIITNNLATGLFYNPDINEPKYDTHYVEFSIIPWCVANFPENVNSITESKSNDYEVFFE